MTETIETPKLKLQMAITSANNTILLLSNALLAFQENIDSYNNDDKKCVEDMLNAIKAIHYSVATLAQTHKVFGTDRNAERYFNFEDGEIVEVDKEHFKGPLNDDDE